MTKTLLTWAVLGRTVGPKQTARSYKHRDASHPDSAATSEDRPQFAALSRTVAQCGSEMIAVCLGRREGLEIHPENKQIKKRKEK